MSEQASAPSAGSESSVSEVATTDSTGNPSSATSSESSGAPNGKASQEIVNAMESAEKQSDGTYELVIDGETVTLTLEEMKAGYQKAKASAKRFQEAAQAKKEADEQKAENAAKREAMRKNPLKFLMEDGVDEQSARKHYEEAVWAWLQQDQMSPEQKQALADQRKHETEKQQLAREKAEIEQWKADRKAEKERAEVEKYQNEFATQLQTTLNKHQLPNNPSVVSKLIEYMKDGLSFDDSYSFEDAVQVYKEEHQQDFKKYLSSLSPAELMAAIGPEGVKAFRKQDVETNIKQPTSTKKPEATKPAPKDSKISSKDFFANLGKR